MKRSALVFALVLAATAAAYGKSTKLVASVTSPTYSGQRFKKVLVIGMSDNPAVRSDFEDAMAARLTRDGVHAVPGHNILLRPKSAKMDADYLKAQIKEHNIDAVIVSRLVSVKTDTTYIPGQAYAMPYPYYGTFYGYYGHLSPIVYTPGYLSHDRTVRVETSLYGTTSSEGEFIWTGLSDTFNPNPKKVDKAIDGVVQVVVTELEKQKIF